MIHHNGAHAYQHVVFEGAAVYNGVVAYRNSAANIGGCGFISAMNNGIVLNVGLVTDADIVYVAANHRIEPHTTLLAHGHFAYNGGVVGNETLVADYRSHAPNRLNKWVLHKVFSENYSRVFYVNDTTSDKKFLHPQSHEIEFMNLNDVFSDQQSAEFYAHKQYRPDFLSIFLYELKSQGLRFEYVNSVKFHFLQLNGWYFEVSRFNREGYNTGLLISNLVKVTDKQKDLIRKMIYHEKK
jgi:hypothetical protein